MKDIINTLKKWKPKRPEKLLIILIILIFLSSLGASLLQSNFGSIDIEYVSLVDEYGNTITGKLYKPSTATYENPAPGVLAAHGMNNDKDTEAPVALELAKRGIVVISVDQHNHGDSDIGASSVDSFFGSADGYENDTMGANVMYQFLKNSEFVDGTQIGLIGHSMGGGTVRDLARINPDHRAIIIQASGLDNATEIATLNNYLNIWPYYEELFTGPMQPRDEFIADGEATITANLATIGITPSVGEYVDHNYGDFALGTAQRYALCKCIHPATTWNKKSIQESVAWMLQALMGETDPTQAMEDAAQQTYLIKEICTLLSLLTAIISILPFTSILLNTKYFGEIKTPMSEKIPNPGKKWWKVAIINTIIGGVTFIIFPGLGMVLGGVITIVLPVFLMLTGNGTLLWLLVNTLICYLLFKRWFKKNRQEKDLTYEDLGAFPKNKSEEQKKYLHKTFLLTVILFVYLYLIVVLIQKFLLVELRFMWPILKIFTPLRFIQFLVYLLPVYLFFKINGGLLMFGQARIPEGKSKAGTVIVWWLKYLFMMELGLLVVFLIQYLPMFVFGTGPTFSIGILGMLFGLFGIFLMQTLPQFAVIYFLMLVLYRKTGKIYVGTYTATMLVTWILVVGGQLV